jgi:intein/homing endonuclease
MNSDEAYVLGVLLGDGSVCHYRRNYVISLTTSNFPFAVSFAQGLRRLGKEPWVGTIAAEHGRHWRVQTYSKALYEMAKPRIVPELVRDAARAFIRGFYESEGSDRGKGRGLEIYNTEPYLLHRVAEMLQAEGISSKVRPRRKEVVPGQRLCWYLTIGARHKTAFLQIIKPCIKVAA